MAERLFDDKKEEILLLREVRVPERFYKRMTTGVKVLDEIFGGTELPGIMPGTIFLFTGGPGAGKSTMALQLADLLQRHAGRSVLYVVGEQSPEAVKYAADRLAIQGDFAVTQLLDVPSIVRKVRETGTEVLFVDSLQTLSDPAANDDPVAMERKLTKLARDGVTVFVIGHVTKSGRFAGRNTLQHDIDAHMHLSFNKETGNRMFELLKNRLGPANMPYEFMLSASGLDFKVVETPPEQAKAPGGRARERREVILALVKRKLMEGEGLSGYCFERLKVDCSGGFWRGMVRMGCQQLQEEGCRIEEKRMDGRLYSFLVSAPDPVRQRHLKEEEV